MSSTLQSYEIRPESIKTFIEDRTIKLPRFQRKQTWDEKKDFALAISVFKGFPLGVVVINKETENRKTMKWLLDGRQRRNALTNMLQDPEAIYLWARRFVGFKQSAEAIEIEDLYWKKIEEYLGADDTEEENDKSQELPQIIGAEMIEPDLDEVVQKDFKSGQKTKQIGGRYQDLDQLLDLLLLTHKKSKRWSRFTQPFDFTECIENLEYVESFEGKPRLNSIKLRSWFLHYRTQCTTNNAPHLDKSNFYEFLKSRYNNKDARLKQKVDRQWEQILERFDCIEIIENKLLETKIGLIELSGANASDAQTTFKIINSSGTPLTAVEILSAKPSWNEPVVNPSESMITATERLYRAIEVEQQEGVVKWDAPAVLIDRLSGLSFVFSKLDYNDGKQLARSITLGFKILSAIHEKGISKEHIDALSQNKTIKWQLEADSIVSDLNQIGRLLNSDPFFRFFGTWKVSLMDLTSDAIAIDFLTRVYLDWKRKDKTIGVSTQTNTFLKNAKILFDSSIYEYLTRQWRGSGDSRVAEHIRQFAVEPPLFTPRLRSEWELIIEEIINNHSINKVKLKAGGIDPLLKPLLYYHYVLQNQTGPDGLDISIEVDHIIPQSTLKASTLDGKDLKTHNLFNLILLPKRENIIKGDKSLKQIDDDWLKDQASRYSGIALGEFDSFSKVQDMESLKEKGKKLFLNSFGPKRDAIFIG